MHPYITSCRNLGNLNTPFNTITKDVLEDGTICYKLKSNAGISGLPLNVNFNKTDVSCCIGSKKNKAKIIDSLSLLHPLIAIYNLKKLFVNNTSNDFLPGSSMDVIVKKDEETLSLDITKYVNKEDVDMDKDYNLYPSYVDCSSEIYSMGKVKGSDVVNNIYNIKFLLMLK